MAHTFENGKFDFVDSSLTIYVDGHPVRVNVVRAHGGGADDEATLAAECLEGDNEELEQAAIDYVIHTLQFRGLM